MGQSQVKGVTVPASERVRVRRGADRGRYQRSDVCRILDAGLIAHVGVNTPDGPLVLPMAYGHDGEHLYLHGAAANHLLHRCLANLVAPAGRWGEADRQGATLLGDGKMGDPSPD